MTIEITPDGEYIATDKFASLYQEHWKEIVPCECGAPWIPAIQICERGLHRLKDEILILSFEYSSTMFTKSLDNYVSLPL